MTVQVLDLCKEITLEVEVRSKFRTIMVHEVIKVRQLDLSYYVGLSNYISQSESLQYVNLNECYKYDKRRKFNEKEKFMVK